MYDYFLFDLDGTLTDPGLGITNSVAYALGKYGITVEDRRELYPFIGPPLRQSFSEFYGFDEEKTKEAVAFYREYFSEKGLFENEVYEGIEAVLTELKSRKKILIVATSKPEAFAVEILKHFHLNHFFDFIAGATMDEKRTKKADVIAYALEQCKITDKASAIMIGDREHDVLGAKQVGLDSVGVLYGYGNYEELENAGATYIVENPGEILKIKGLA